MTSMPIAAKICASDDGAGVVAGLAARRVQAVELARVAGDLLHGREAGQARVGAAVLGAAVRRVVGVVGDRVDLGARGGRGSLRGDDRLVARVGRTGRLSARVAVAEDDHDRRRFARGVGSKRGLRSVDRVRDVGAGAARCVDAVVLVARPGAAAAVSGERDGLDELRTGCQRASMRCRSSGSRSRAALICVAPSSTSSDTDVARVEVPGREDRRPVLRGRDGDRRRAARELQLVRRRCGAAAERVVEVLAAERVDERDLPLVRVRGLAADSESTR